MVNITSFKGEQYSFDQSTNRIFKDGILVPYSQAEPVYTKLQGDDAAPEFSGILLKTINSILTLSGKLNPVNEENTIS